MPATADLLRKLVSALEQIDGWYPADAQTQPLPPLASLHPMERQAVSSIFRDSVDGYLDDEDTTRLPAEVSRELWKDARRQARSLMARALKNKHRSILVMGEFHA